MEKWKSVDQFFGYYEISEYGILKRLNRIYIISNGYKVNVREMIIKPKFNAKGYLYYHVKVNKKNIRIAMHRLVAYAFIPNPENKPMVNHINGIKTDNSIENLEWCTASENSIHAFKTGLSNPCKGECNGTSKLKNSDILKIRAMSDYGMTLIYISAIYKISISQVWKIHKRHHWKHI